MTKNTISTNQNNFTIVAMAKHCEIQNITIDFHAPFNLNKIDNSIVPKYLSDRNHYTPAFILPREKEYFLRNGNFQRFTFEQKVAKLQHLANLSQNNEQGIKNIQTASPADNNCQICKSTYTCYPTHIKQQQHKTNISQNPTNPYIQQLCIKYQDQRNTNNINKSLGIGQNCQLIQHRQQIENYLYKQKIKTYVIKVQSNTANTNSEDTLPLL